MKKSFLPFKVLVSPAHLDFALKKIEQATTAGIPGH